MENCARNQDIHLSPSLMSPEMSFVNMMKTNTDIEILSHIETFRRDSRLKTAVFEVGGENGLDFFSFNNLFETFLGSVAGGVMSTSRIQHSMNVTYDKNEPKIVYVQMLKPACIEEVHHGNNFSINGKNVRCWFMTKPTQCTVIPVSSPTEVSLQRQWRFTYKNKFNYVLVQSHIGKNKNEALTKLPKYWFRLELVKDNVITGKSVQQLVQSIVLKLRDVIANE